MISIDNISFSYGKGEYIFKDFSLEVKEGSIFGLLGPNGSGKTTLMRLILNLIYHEGGNIKIKGESNSRNNTQLYKSIGSLIETPSLYGHLSGRENLQLFSQIYGVSKSRIEECLALVNLEGAATKKFKRYSLGMKQRLAIASCMLHDPDILLLDEPMNGLDPQGMHDIRELLIDLHKNHKKTIFISSHILSEIESTCTDIGIIKNGSTVFNGSMKALHHQLNSNHQLIIETKEPGKANELLKDRLDTMIQNNHLIINMTNSLSNADIIKELSINNIPINQAFNKKNNLESLFLEITK